MQTVKTAVFILMFLVFFYGNYIVFLKLLSLRKKPDTEPVDLMRWLLDFKKGLWFLDFSATTSPLLGLLGTVIGLIMAFVELGRKGVAGAGEISSAIGLALVATAVGIAMSLWFYLWYKFLISKHHQIKEELKIKLLEEEYEETKTFVNA
uniref:MotA/TolQ/ExbB proton channel family protein n=1 Tax=Thermocrinis ruber TaxID=75906 RepID=A0A7C5X0Z8_9AQUI